MHTTVLAQNLAAGGHDLTGGFRRRCALLLEVGLDKAGIISVRDEANLLALALVGHRKAHLGGEPSNLRLAHGPQGKQAVCELLLGQAEEKIRLVLSVIESPAEQISAADRVEFDARVVPGG